MKEQKLKVKKNGRVYDREWHMFFPCEKARRDFRRAIAEAEKDIEEGKVITQQEMEEYIEQEFGIVI